MEEEGGRGEEEEKDRENTEIIPRLHGQEDLTVDKLLGNRDTLQRWTCTGIFYF